MPDKDNAENATEIPEVTVTTRSNPLKVYVDLDLIQKSVQIKVELSRSSDYYCKIKWND